MIHIKDRRNLLDVLVIQTTNNKQQTTIDSTINREFLHGRLCVDATINQAGISTRIKLSSIVNKNTTTIL